MSLAVEAAGWTGAALLLLAYALASAGRLAARGGAFQALNVMGASGLALNAGLHGAWPSAVLNTVWAAIGVASLLGAARTRR